MDEPISSIQVWKQPDHNRVLPKVAVGKILLILFCKISMHSFTFRKKTRVAVQNGHSVWLTGLYRCRGTQMYNQTQEQGTTSVLTRAALF